MIEAMVPGGANPEAVVPITGCVPDTVDPRMLASMGMACMGMA